MTLIREMTRADIEFAFACTKAEGWMGETTEVFEDFVEHDAEGCFIAELDSRRAGVCVATRYRKNGFVGELVVVRGLRGMGIGESLFERALHYLRTAGMETICLDGDLDAVPFYERRGFRKLFRSLRFVGSVKGVPPDEVRPFREGDMAGVKELDLVLFGDDRSFFLQRRLERNPDLCFVLESREDIIGYVMARPGVGVVSVGPWAARTDRGAIDLLVALSSRTGTARLRLGVPEKNPRAVGLIRSLGSFEEGTPCWRMALGRGSALGVHKDLLGIGSAAKG